MNTDEKNIPSETVSGLPGRLHDSSSPSLVSNSNYQKAKQVLSGSRTHTHEELLAVIQSLVNDIELNRLRWESQSAELSQTRNALSSAVDDYYTLYDNAPVGYITLNEKFAVIRANKHALELFEKSHDELLSQSVLQLLVGIHGVNLYAFLTELLVTGQARHCIAMPTGFLQKFLRCTANAEKTGEGSVTEIRMILEDVSDQEMAREILQNYQLNLRNAVEEKTESLQQTNMELQKQIELRLHTENELLRSEEDYHKLFITMEQGVALHRIILDSSGKPCDYLFINVNPAYERITGLLRENIIGKTVKEVLPDIENIWIERYGEVAITGDSIAFDHFVPELHAHFAVRAYRPYPEHFVVLVENITKQKAADEALRVSEQLYRTLIETSGDGIVLTDLNGIILFANKQKAEMHNYDSVEAIIGENVFNHFVPSELPAVMQQLGLIMEKRKVFFESVAIDLQGNPFPVEISSALIYNEQQQPVQIMSTVRNISARKQAEAMLLQSLQEKELLIREIHHRVKNNFQVISSLLNLQGNLISDPDTAAILTVSKNRIKAMSIVNELMYQNKNFAAIEVGSYISNLVSYLRSTFSGQMRQVELRIEVPEINLTIDQISPLGLILNELITNAFKHAYQDCSSPLLEIKVEELPQDQLILSVRDNGKGLPEGYIIDDNCTLGLPLTVALSEQLSGQFRFYSTESGSTFSLQFTRKAIAG